MKARAPREDYTLIFSLLDDIADAKFRLAVAFGKTRDAGARLGESFRTFETTLQRLPEAFDQTDCCKAENRGHDGSLPPLPRFGKAELPRDRQRGADCHPIGLDSQSPLGGETCLNPAS